MSLQDDASTSSSEGAGYSWILEHLLAYPGSYEIPLRTMYTLNSTTQAQPQQSLPTPPTSSPTSAPGNAFPIQKKDEQHNLTTATAAAQLRASLMSHISQLPSQPCSLPPSFVTGFVRRCFSRDLHLVDFLQTFTALDYLKDLEVRRRREVVAALDRLGVAREDLGERAVLGRKYPGVLKWVIGIEDKERKVEALYTQIYLGLRRWNLINELSLTPFNKANCIAMLNTLFPPAMGALNGQFVQPTHQLTPAVLTSQRTGFFRYIKAVEKNGTAVLKCLIHQGERAGENSGWPSVREAMEKYLRMANGIIDECSEITGKDSVQSPVLSNFSGAEVDDEKRRKVDSGISFTASSNRGSMQSHQTRPSISSTATSHSRNQSTEKPLPPNPPETVHKPAGSTLERIAREIRKIKSRGEMRDSSRSRPAATISTDMPMVDADAPPPLTPSKERKLRLRPSLMKMRSSGALRERDANSSGSTPPSRDGQLEGEGESKFDVVEMKRNRMVWEAQQKRKGSKDSIVTMDVDR